MRRLRGKRLGLIGLGNIGCEVAGMAAALGMEVVAFTPGLTQARAEMAGAQSVSLDDLLSTADFVSLHAPLNEETTGIMGVQSFSSMKATAYLVNTSRGALVDEEALYNALTTGEIAGAALDVRAPEPPSDDDPLRQLDNVLHTPHSSFYSTESIEELQHQTAWEIRRILSGETPHNIVNPGFAQS